MKKTPVGQKRIIAIPIEVHRDVREASKRTGLRIGAIVSIALKDWLKKNADRSI